VAEERPAAGSSDDPAVNGRQELGKGRLVEAARALQRRVLREKEKEAGAEK